MQGPTEKNRSVAQPAAVAFILRGFLFRFLLSLPAVGNGAVGELPVTPRFGAYANHLYKSALMLVFIAVFFMPYLTAAAAARKADPGY